MNFSTMNMTESNFGLRMAALSVALSVAILLAACGERNDSPEDAGVEPAASIQTESGSREIPVSGSLVFPNTAAISFESPGIVGEILVSVGDTVQKGQTLASLDTQSMAQLEAAVAQAQVRVTNAENNLKSLHLEPTPDIATAALEVARAEVAAYEEQRAFDDIRRRPGINSEAAQLAVAEAEIALDDARARLEDLLTPQQLAVSGAEAAVAAARVELDAAQEAYDDIKDGRFPEEVLRDARNGVAFAVTALEAATRAQSDSQADMRNVLMQAEDAEYIAREQYVSLFRYWLGTEPTDAELQITPMEVIAEWGIDLDATFHRFNPEYADIEPTRDNPDTRWFEPKIWAWINLHPTFGGVVPTCTDEKVLAKTERCITREFEQGYDALKKAQDALAAARNSSDTAAEKNEDAVAAAQAALSDARDALGDAEEGPDDSMVESAEKQLQLAKATLQQAEEDLTELTVNIDLLDVARARAALAQAEVALEDADDAHDRSKEDDLYVYQAGRQLEHAAAALANAKTSLDASRHLLSDQITEAEAELALARTTLEEAKEALDGAVVRAPMDGTVSIINVSVDDPVDDELPAVEIIATDVVEIDGAIDGADRPFVQEGATAVVTLESLGDTPLGGSVSFISEEARTERGIISYAVRIRVNVPSGVSVPLSLSPVSVVIIAMNTGSDSATFRGERYRNGSERVPTITAHLHPIHGSPTAAL